jgi:hypothetical protein
MLEPDIIRKRVHARLSKGFIATDSHQGRRTGPPLATFRGRHNAVKSKCFIILYSLDGHNDFNGLTYRQLADTTGCLVCTVKTRVGKWCAWKYIKRIDSIPYRYMIAARGKHFIENILPDEALARYMNEMGV